MGCSCPGSLLVCWPSLRLCTDFLLGPAGFFWLQLEVLLSGASLRQFLAVRLLFWPLQPWTSRRVLAFAVAPHRPSFGTFWLLLAPIRGGSSLASLRHFRGTVWAWRSVAPPVHLRGLTASVWPHRRPVGSMAASSHPHTIRLSAQSFEHAGLPLRHHGPRHHGLWLHYPPTVPSSLVSTASYPLHRSCIPSIVRTRFYGLFSTLERRQGQHYTVKFLG